MPAPLAPLIGFVLGVVFAWWGADELARSQNGSAVFSRSIVVVILFAALVFTPISGYFLAFETDWSFAYWADSRQIPSALQLTLVLLNMASVPLGFIAAASPARKRRLGTLLALGLPPILIVLAFLLRAAGRLSVHASYAQFHGDFGIRPIAGSSLGHALLWMDTMLALGIVWTNRELRRLCASSMRGSFPSTISPR
jgi:hypothetical protein